MIKLYDLEKYLDRTYNNHGETIRVYDFAINADNVPIITFYSLTTGNMITTTINEFKKIARGDGTTNIKNWYRLNYPGDDMGNEINPELTFNELIIALYFREDGYQVIGVGDSLIRERITEKAADIYVMGYGDIYELWTGDKENKFKLADFGLKYSIV